MKKFLNISVIAALAILPLAANATYTQEEIKTADATTVATTGYVKGAYNALNTSKQDKLTDDQLQAITDVTDLKTTVGDSTSGLVKDVADLKTAGYATTTDVAATVNAATGSVTGVSLGVTGTPTGTVESTLSGAKVNIPTTATVPTLTTWGNDNSNSTATVTLNTTETAVNGTVTSTFTGTGIDSGTATGSITGIDVTVSGYQAN